MIFNKYILKEKETFINMKLKILGTQSPYSKENHNCPGFFIQDGNNKLLLDCGSGSHSLLNFPNDLNGLSVILSHLHRDHYNDIYNIQYSSFVFHNQKIIEKPIDIYLPSNPTSIFDDITGEPNSYATYTTINENSNIHVGHMDVSFCRTDHPVETYAVRISNGESTIVYTSDTSFSCKDRIVEFAKNADLLICESSLLTSYGFAEINPHLTAKQAGIIAKESEVKALMLTHFWPEELPEKYVEEAKLLFPKTIAAEERKVIDLSKFKEKDEDAR